MSSLDLPTVLIVCATLGVLMAAVLFLMWRNYLRVIRGVAQWAAASAMCSMSAMLFAGHDTLPTFLSTVLACLLLLSGCVLFHLGLQRFLGEQPAPRLIGGAVGVVTVMLAWTTWLQPHYGAQVFFLSLFLLSLAVLSVVQLLRKGPSLLGSRSWPLWLMVGILLAWAALLLLRVLTAWSEPAARQPSGLSSMQLAYLVGTSLALLAATIGVALLASSRLQREFEYLALRDVLTQALTRRAFIEACDRELDRCRRHHRDMALLLVDIDHFKVINDASGRDVGDEVILDLSARIDGVLRRVDQLGRYEGESFAVLLPEAGPKDALIVAERIRDRIASLHLSLPPYTVSIGATINLPGEDQIDTLLTRADKALHQAKAGGRNCVVLI